MPDSTLAVAETVLSNARCATLARDLAHEA